MRNLKIDQRYPYFGLTLDIHVFRAEAEVSELNLHPDQCHLYAPPV